jgi:hypothetical protein
MSVRGEERKFQKLFSTIGVFVYTAFTSFELQKPSCWGGVKKLRSAFFFQNK